MVKRYYAGLISSTKRTTSVGNFVSGIYNKNIHLQTTFADAFPPYDLRDTYFKYTTLLLNGNPPSPTFVTDASTNSFPISVVGDTKPNNFNPYSAGYYSNYFDGTGDYLDLPASSLWDFGLNNFTVEAWVYPTSAQTQLTIVTNYHSSISTWFFGITSTLTNLSFQNSSYAVDASFAFSINTWYHIAAVKNGTILTLYINGNAIASGNWTYNHTNNGQLLRIGVTYSTFSSTFSGYWYGYISNLRVVNGDAAYTGNFTPPTAPLTTAGSTSAASYSSTANVNITFPQANTSLLTCFGNRLKDDSTNNVTITKNGDTKVNAFHPFVSPYGSYASTYFDGSGDYLTVPYNSALNLGSGTTWTIEYWVYFNAAFGTYTPISFVQTSVLRWGIEHAAASTNFVFNNSAAVVFTNPSTLTPNTWYHIAWVRDGTTVRMYINGVASSTTSVQNLQNISSGPLNIGYNAVSGYEFYMNGYITNVRLVKGNAVYTGNFIPPAAPLTDIGSTSAASYSSTANVNITFPQANTSLLTCQNLQPTNNSMFLDKSNNSFVITRNGNSTQGTFGPYGSNWSNYVNGSSGVLVSSTSAQFSFAGDFTWEAWINPSALPSSGNSVSIICSRGTVASNSAFQFNLKNSSGTYAIEGTFSIGASDSNLVWNIPTAPTLGTWYHVALVRSGSSVQAYWNGTAIGSAQTASGTTNTPTVNPSIGFRGGSYNDLYFTGYIADLRLADSALYTGATLTVPTAPLTAISGTRLLTCQSNRFIDNSTNNFTLTAYSLPTIQRFSPYTPIFDSSLNPKLNNAYTPSIHGGSAYFDGTGDFLTTASSSAFGFGTGAFTIECWLYWIGGSGENTLVCVDVTNGVNIFLNSSGWGIGTRAVAVNNQFGTAPTKNMWHHIAVSRSGSTIYAFIDGVRVYSGANSTDYQAAGPFGIAAIGTAAGNIINGYISDLRVVKGTAVYTGNFTPPNKTLLPYGTSATYNNTANVNTTFAAANTALLCNFTDAAIYDATMNVNLETLGDARVSTANSKFGGSSMFFDGTGDSLKIPSSAQHALGTSNFTIEMWVYNTSTTNRLISYATTTSPIIYFNTSNFLLYENYGVGTVLTSSISVPLNTWAHIAVCRSSGVTKIFINGVEGASGADTNNWGQNGIYIGVDVSTTYMTGYIDDLRITRYARYTANFTPPTASFRLK